MIGYSGISDSAEKDRVEWAQLLQPVVGHHAAGFQKALAAPIEVLPAKADVVLSPDSFQNSKSFGHDLAANAVSFNHCNRVFLHGTYVSRIPGRAYYLLV